jgi:hypothetical protein
VFQLLLRAARPRFSGAAAPARLRAVKAFHSKTSTSISTPTSARFCWMNSFMISGYICPDPEVEIATLNLR